MKKIIPLPKNYEFYVVKNNAIKKKYSDEDRRSPIFVGSKRALEETIDADDLGKRGTNLDRKRQEFFRLQLEKLAKEIGNKKVPVYLEIDGEKLRMDKGCIGHASDKDNGFLESVLNSNLGFVEYVVLK